MVAFFLCNSIYFYPARLGKVIQAKASILYSGEQAKEGQEPLKLITSEIQIPKPAPAECMGKHYEALTLFRLMLTMFLGFDIRKC